MQNLINSGIGLLSARAFSRRPNLSVGPLAVSYFRQSRLEIAPVTVRAHPAFRARDTLQLSSFDHQELVGLACSPEYSNAIFPALNGADATYSAVPNPNAITDCKPLRSHASAKKNNQPES
jgi:hypothetical protein